MTNDEKYNIYKKKKIFRYLIILFSLLTIFLEALALFRVISYLYGLIPFVLLYIVKYFNAKIDGKSDKKNTKTKKKKDK